MNSPKNIVTFFDICNNKDELDKSLPDQSRVRDNQDYSELFWLGSKPIAEHQDAEDVLWAPANCQWETGQDRARFYLENGLGVVGFNQRFQREGLRFKVCDVFMNVLRRERFASLKDFPVLAPKGSQCDQRESVTRVIETLVSEDESKDYLIQLGDVLKFLDPSFAPLWISMSRNASYTRPMQWRSIQKQPEDHCKCHLVMFLIWISHRSREGDIVAGDRGNDEEPVLVRVVNASDVITIGSDTSVETSHRNGEGELVTAEVRRFVYGSSVQEFKVLDGQFLLLDMKDKLFQYCGARAISDSKLYTIGVCGCGSMQDGENSPVYTVRFEEVVDSFPLRQHAMERLYKFDAISPKYSVAGEDPKEWNNRPPRETCVCWPIVGEARAIPGVEIRWARLGHPVRIFVSIVPQVVTSASQSPPQLVEVGYGTITATPVLADEMYEKVNINGVEAPSLRSVAVLVEVVFYSTLDDAMKYPYPSFMDRAQRPVKLLSELVVGEVYPWDVSYLQPLLFSDTVSNEDLKSGERKAQQLAEKLADRESLPSSENPAEMSEKSQLSNVVTTRSAKLRKKTTSFYIPCLVKCDKS